MYQGMNEHHTQTADRLWQPIFGERTISQKKTRHIGRIGVLITIVSIFNDEI